MAGYVIHAPDGSTEAVTDNGDGTGTRVLRNPQGGVISTAPVTGLYVESAEERNRRLIVAALTQLLADATAAKATIATGKTLLTPIRTRANYATANLAAINALNADIKNLAIVLDGLLGIDSGVIDRVVGLARFTTGDFSAIS